MKSNTSRYLLILSLESTQTDPEEIEDLQRQLIKSKNLTYIEERKVQTLSTEKDNLLIDRFNTSEKLRHLESRLSESQEQFKAMKSPSPNSFEITKKLIESSQMNKDLREALFQAKQVKEKLNKHIIS